MAVSRFADGVVNTNPPRGFVAGQCRITSGSPITWRRVTQSHSVILRQENPLGRFGAIFQERRAQSSVGEHKSNGSSRYSRRAGSRQKSVQALGFAGICASICCLWVLLPCLRLVDKRGHPEPSLPGPWTDNRQCTHSTLLKRGPGWSDAFQKSPYHNPLAEWGHSA